MKRKTGGLADFMPEASGQTRLQIDEPLEDMVSEEHQECCLFKKTPRVLASPPTVLLRGEGIPRSTTLRIFAFHDITDLRRSGRLMLASTQVNIWSQGGR